MTAFSTLCLAALLAAPRPTAALPGARIAGGTFHDGDFPVFLVTACPLTDFAQVDISPIVDVLAAKGYNNFKLNLYWDHFDTNGDGALDRSLANLNAAISRIRSLGLYASLSFETYNVGGGGVPAAFFTAHPEAQAVNESGELVFDTEYGTNKRVPSIFHAAYLQASRDFIRSVLAGVDTDQILYFETTVEPQYLGNQTLDYSDAGRTAYEAWCGARGFPFSWPPAASDVQWNNFRAEALAEWIEGDAAAIRDAAGAGALVAVDYLETGGADMRNRNGGSDQFLDALDGVDIIQCNWHWLPGTNTPFELAYDRAGSRVSAKAWAVTEHMTINGSDFRAAHIPDVLQHTLDRGNAFGWEIVTTTASTTCDFCVYNDDWSPKSVVVEIDTNLACWLSRIAGGSCAEWEAAVFSSRVPAHMVQGESAAAWIDYRNLGTHAWDADTRLGTQDPADRTSPFYTAGDWLSENRPAAAPASGVTAGLVHRFAFTLTAPAVTEPTTYEETFGLVHEGVTWIAPPSPTAHFSITVWPDAIPEEYLEEEVEPAWDEPMAEIPDAGSDASGDDPALPDDVPADGPQDAGTDIPDAEGDTGPDGGGGGCGCAVAR